MGGKLVKKMKFFDGLLATGYLAQFIVDSAQNIAMVLAVKCVATVLNKQ